MRLGVLGTFLMYSLHVSFFRFHCRSASWEGARRRFLAGNSAQITPGEKLIMERGFGSHVEAAA